MSQKDALLAADGYGSFYKNVRHYKSKERPKPFDILAVYFNVISDEFDPLQLHEISITKPRQLPVLQPFQVAGRIRSFKKPKSMLQGDIFPALFGKFGDILAIPLTSIYNEISASRVWPACWKKEFVTVILKKTLPESVNDLRNISCTLLPSKIYGSYVLNWLQEEVNTKDNQFGGVKGCGTAHFLVQVLDEIWRTIGLLLC